MDRLTRWLCVIFVGGAGTTGCATAPQMPPMDWPGFIASFEGERTSQVADYGTPDTVLVTYKDPKSGPISAKRWFAAWCASQKGEAVGLNASNARAPIARALYWGLSLKLNAEQANGRQYAQSETTGCMGTSEPKDLMYGMFFQEVIPPRVGGPWPPQHRYAFYTAEQAQAFEAAQQSISRERGAALRQSVNDRAERQTAATRALRQNPRVGDRTLVGVIVEVKLPLVLIQYDELYRKLGNRPQTEWVNVDTISAPVD